MDTQTALTNYFRAAFPCVCLKTSEEQRAVADILAISKRLKKTVWVWDAQRGLVRSEDGKEQSDTSNIGAALNFILDQNAEDTIYILLDMHQYSQEFQYNGNLARTFKNVLMTIPEQGSSVVLLGVEFSPWTAIQNYVSVLDYALPNATTLKMIAQEVGKSANKKEIEISEDLIRALSGLSTSEAENALSLSVVETGKFSPEVVYREKIAAVKRSGLLEIVTPDPKGLDAIGGLENLKEWILKRKKAYSGAAEKFGLPTPRGILLVGVPGTGKSLSAQAFGVALGIPTLKVDLGSMFSSLVGETEAKIKATMELADAMAPCVLWMDEVDKGLSGASGTGNNDSGVTRRLFGALIDWMQRRTKPVFIAATANQVANLPVEFLRKGGRFDELFALDLPSPEEREQILKVQLRKYKREPNDFVLAKIVEVTNNFSGAEIESMVVDALYNAFDADAKALTTEHLIQAAESTIPLAKTMAEQIQSIRDWAGEGRARMASKQQKREQPTNKRRMTIEGEDN